MRQKQFNLFFGLDCCIIIIGGSEMATLQEKRTAWFYVHTAIGLFLMFVAGHILEPVYPLTDVGVQVLAVFVGVLWLWCFVGFLWPSLLALVAFGLTDFAPFATTINSAFGAGVPILLLFSMILFGSPQHVGATKYITRWFLTRKIFNNRPIVFSFVFIMATYALSIAINVTPALILMWTVLYGVLKDLGYKPGDKYSTLMLIGTFLGAISGQASLPFTGSTLAILSVYATAVYEITGQQMPIPHLQYILLGMINSVIVFVIYCLLIKFVFKPDLTNVANVNTEMFEKNPLPPMSKLQRANFYGMLAFVVMMLLPSFLPSGFVVTELLETIGATGAAILITGVMVLLRVDNQPVLDFKDVAANSINWDVYVMVVAALAISGALTNPATGVVDMMIVVLEPVLGGHTPAVFFVIMLLFGIFVTSFGSALVISIATMPVLVAFGYDSGANLPAVAATFTLLVHYSIILPSASVFAAMLWSNKEWVTGREVFRYGMAIVIVATLVSLFIMMPISSIML